MDAKADFRNDHLAAWRSSNLTPAAYWRQHNLSILFFVYGRRIPEAAILPTVIGKARSKTDTIEVYLLRRDRALSWRHRAEWL